MNKKIYVPFETAVLLNKKGYPQDSCDMYYNPNSELRTQVELIAGYKEYYPFTEDIRTTKQATISAVSIAERNYHPL